MKDKIIECIVKATDNQELKNMGVDDSFDSHDVDSLDRMSIMVEVEGMFDIELDDVDPKEINSIADYIKAVTANLPS